MFIAEMSSNHDQDLDRCIKLIESASDSGFDAIKFQAFKVESLFAKEILQKSKSHMNRKKWELPLEFLPKIRRRCLDLNLKLGITPFYLEAVNICNEYIDFFKIASYEILWHDLLIKCCQKNKPIIISTGMAEIKEIYDAVKVLEKNKCKDLTIMHCVSSYPASSNRVNLSAISNMKKLFGWPIGWSDHSNNKNVIISAFLKWKAKDIEMHLDLDGNGAEFAPGHCWLPEQAKEVIQLCKETIKFDGSGEKKPTKEELKERMWRADPSDGLRPLRKIRKSWKP